MGDTCDNNVIICTVQRGYGQMARTWAGSESTGADRVERRWSTGKAQGNYRWGSDSALAKLKPRKSRANMEHVRRTAAAWLKTQGMPR